MEGRYLHMVADMSKSEPDAFSLNEVSICSLGVFGTQYLRDGEAIPSSVEVKQGESLKLNIERIYSLVSLGNTLSIKLRQADP